MASRVKLLYNAAQLQAHKPVIYPKEIAVGKIGKTTLR